MTNRALLPALALLTACAADTTPADGEAIAAQKVDVCHTTGNGSYQIININQSAVQTHINNHGDHLAGVYYLDADGDGQGDPDETFDCMEPGTVDNGDDCDDGDATTYDGAEEVCDDGIDNDCDGDIDEECTVLVDVHVAGDNAVWACLDGQPLTLDSMTPSWQIGRTAQIELDSGTTHALSFYVEDWGGLAYFAATVRVDGVPVASSGYGDFAEASSLLSDGSTYTRESNWANQPDDASDSFNMLFSPGSTWGDWMQVGYDDSAWGSDTNTCSSPSNWNTSTFVLSWVGFDEMYDDGAAFVWPQHGSRAAGSCSSWGWAAAAYRVEIAL